MSIQLFRQLYDQLRQEVVVMAIVISGRGSVPREVGAKMLIWANGTAGTIGGGAGEANVIQAARETLATGQPQRIEIDLSGVAHRVTQGVCGGHMQVWLVRWSGGTAVERARKIVHEIIDVLANANPPPSSYLVWPLVGDMDSAAQSTAQSDVQPTDAAAALPYIVTSQVASAALGLDVLPLEQPAIATVVHQARTIPAFIEPLRPDPTLLIVGAGHVGIALAQAAQFAGFCVAVQDDRPEWATPERLPPNTHILPGAIAEALTNFPLSINSYIALVTRGYAHDVAALTSILTHHTELPVRYLGMIGSHKRSQLVFQALREQGIAASVIQAIHAPIGLNIGALTPEEIAISIVAELIQIRRA